MLVRLLPWAADEGVVGREVPHETLRELGKQQGRQCHKSAYSNSRHDHEVVGGGGAEQEVVPPAVHRSVTECR